MYLRHFGLEKPLFDDGIARDAAVFVSAADRDALAHASLAMASRDSIVVLLGPPGIGKTTFAATAVGAAGDSSRVVTAWLGTPALSPYEMLELLLLEFGFDPYRHTRVERLQTWREFLIEMATTETRLFIAVEHADDLDPAVLKALAALTSADPNGCPGANVVLMGQDRLLELLGAPDLAEVRQRVRLSRRFEPYDEATLQQYLEHCVRAAGGDFEAVFGADAVAALHAHTGGIPRLINHVAGTALGLIAGRGAGRVTASAIRAAAVEVCGLSELAPAAADVVESDPEPEAEVEPAPPDEIPVLTEQVDVDLDAADRVDAPGKPAAREVRPSERRVAPASASMRGAGAYPESGASRETGAARPAVRKPETELPAAAATPEAGTDIVLDELSPELVDAILSADDSSTNELGEDGPPAEGGGTPSLRIRASA